MLLHGNCRILGAKDSHGRLTARAVSRLLIDDITGLPVLYVETPYGSVDEDSYVEVSISILFPQRCSFHHHVAALHRISSNARSMIKQPL